eukprot:3432040-Heterocapsa_arctica.AAC.1
MLWVHGPDPVAALAPLEHQRGGEAAVGDGPLLACAAEDVLAGRQEHLEVGGARHHDLAEDDV